MFRSTFLGSDIHVDPVAPSWYVCGFGGTLPFPFPVPSEGLPLLIPLIFVLIYVYHGEKRGM